MTKKLTTFLNRKASCDFCCYSKNLYLSNLIGPEMHLTWTLDTSYNVDHLFISNFQMNSCLRLGEDQT